MNDFERLALLLLAVASFHLLPAALGKEIPARWPIRPLTRKRKPRLYDATLFFFLSVFVVGAVLLIFNAGK